MNKPKGDDAQREQTPSPAQQMQMDKVRDTMPPVDWDQLLQEQYERRRPRV